MTYLLLGLTVLVLGLLAARAFTVANPAVMARQLRFLGGVLLMAIAAVLALRGRIDFAIMLGFVGWGLLMGRGVLPWGAGGWGGSGPRTHGQGSRVETDHLDMELDHDTGAIRGRVLKGRFAGDDIETLTPAELALLWQDYSFSDPTSAQLLEAYLDQRHPTWREDLSRHGPDADADGPGAHHQTGLRPGGMTRQEALEILGLEEGAGDEAVRAAHRELMKKYHPDRGGTNYLASKINEAKAVLIGD
jgi:hypothetical protein